jgi:peptidyl-prolyl cis-trans isomerase D
MLVHPHSYVISYFTDRKAGRIYERFADANGQLDIRKLNKFVVEMKPEEEKFWKQLEDQVRDIRMNEKYFTLIKKGFYTTENEAKDNYISQRRTVDLKFVLKPYAALPDSAVKVTDEEIQKYYNEHQYLYNNDETTRKVEYVVWESVPSKADIDTLYNQMKSLAADFRTQNADGKNPMEDTTFVVNNTDSNEQPDIATFKKGTINPGIDSSIYVSPVGTVFGPYMDNNSIKVSKLMGLSSVADSGKVRHLLIAYAGAERSQAKRSREEAKNLADSLMALLKKGGSFDQLVDKYSDDPGKQKPVPSFADTNLKRQLSQLLFNVKDTNLWRGKGGQYGWIKADQPGMAKAFVQGATENKKGDIFVKESEFGYHIMEVMDISKNRQPRYTIGTVSVAIAPSKETTEMYFAKAGEFAGRNNTAELFDKAVEAEKLNKRIADNIKEGERNVPGLENPKEFVRAIYNAKLGEIITDNNGSNVFTFGNRFIVAKLAEIREKGTAPLEQVKDQVTMKAKQEKKAEQFLQEFASKGAGAKTPEEYAAKLGLQVMSAEKTTFTAFSIPNMGRDDDFMGVMAATKAGAVSKPFKGDIGVFVLKVEKEELPPAKDYKENKKAGNLAIANRAEYETYDALKKLANIEDHKAQKDY